jgi:antitoxin component YwqK of YwqJK toxin-antitoxin module
MKSLLFIFLSLPIISFAQDAIPKPKTKEERKKEQKGKKLEERIEEALPVDIGLPSANATVAGKSISSVDDAKKLITETLPDLGLKVTKKAKKIKKDLTKNKPAFDGKTYEKTAVEKRIIRSGVGERMNYEEFYVMKIDQKPNLYVRDVYWYDTKANKVQSAVSRNNTRSQLLHGPYKRWIGSMLVEEGFYFVGTKHKRWISYDKNFNIVDKQYYKKGFLESARFNYWDDDSTRIREVLPVSYGKISGNYFSFHDNGVMEQEGRLDDSVAVGKWVEYYPIGKKMKKEVQYGKDRYDATEPYVIREYDEKGKIIYEAPKSKQ